MGTRSLITFIISHLPPRCQRCWVLQGHGVLALMPICVVLVLSSISAHCTQAQHHGEYSPYLPLGWSGKSTPQCQRQSPATLFSKRELTTCNTFSVLSGELFTASQCSTRAHAERTMATWYHMLCSGHWLPPPTGASGSPTC